MPGNTAGMTYHTPTLAIAPSQPSRVVVLRCRDTFQIDPVPVRALFTGQPEHVAEATVRRALESIAARPDRLQLARRTGAYDEIGDPARRIASIAGGLGLTDVQRIAGSVANAALSGSTDFMHLFGHTCLGLMWAQMAKASMEALEAGASDATFYETKIATGRYYMARQLPATGMHLARINSGAETVMALAAEAF